MEQPIEEGGVEQPIEEGALSQQHMMMVAGGLPSGAKQPIKKVAPNIEAEEISAQWSLTATCLSRYPVHFSII